MSSNAPPGLVPSGLYLHSDPYTTEKGEHHLTVPERVPAEFLETGRVHIVTKGERIHDIAITYYRGQHPQPVDLWEALAQIQDPPIQDPERPLPPGSVIVVPDISDLMDVAYGDTLRDTPKL